MVYIHEIFFMIIFTPNECLSKYLFFPIGFRAGCSKRFEQGEQMHFVRARWLNRSIPFLMIAILGSLPLFAADHQGNGKYKNDFDIRVLDSPDTHVVPLRPHGIGYDIISIFSAITSFPNNISHRCCNTISEKLHVSSSICSNHYRGPPLSKTTIKSDCSLTLSNYSLT